MNNIDIANGLIFQKLGIDKSTFAERLISQKKIYLLQELGLNLGYSYNWYVHGPYSPNLTTYIYDNGDMLKEEDFKDFTLTEDAEKKADHVNSLDKDRPDDLAMPQWYELLASVLYLNKTFRVPEHEISKRLKEFKPQFSNSGDVNMALEVLKAHGFTITEASA